MIICDVLIVGGGPTGVTLALLLALRGVRVIVAEKEAAIYPLPRAAHIDHETMRILQECGVADRVAETCRTTSRYDFLTADRQVLLRFEGMDGAALGGWPASNMIHQPTVEAALRAALADRSEATLHRRWSFRSFTEIEDGITASFDTPDGAQQVRARYLIGADGARSPVRSTAGIGFDDLGFEEPWLVVDMVVLDQSRLPTANLQICDPKRPTTCVLMGEGRHRWEFMLLPGETAEQVSAPDFVNALMKPWDVEGAVKLERTAVYTFQARIAAQWHKGRVLLAGDAAHQTPPFAGQGLCSGQRDAANLAWKLAAIVKDGASDSLLESYQPEREPNLRATIQMAVMMGQTVCITDPEAAAVRDAQMLAARAAGQSPDGGISYPPIESGLVLDGTAGAGSYFPQPVVDGQRLDDVLGAGHWLITKAGLAQSPFSQFAAKLAPWFEKLGVEAVLVRPDRYVFGTGTPALLAQEWTRALTA